MSLQGSLETFAIPDVLVLLSSTKKTGELRVVGGQVDGRLWFDGGQVVQASVGGDTVGYVDGVFEILRLLEGTFSFTSDAKAPSADQPAEVESVLEGAQAQLSEWHAIAEVVPHLDCTLGLAPKLPDDEVVVNRSQWQIMVKVAGGTSVRQLMDTMGMSEFKACKAVRGLIDSGLLSIDTSVKPRSARSEPAKGMSVPVDEAIPAAKSAPANGANGSSGKANGSAEPKEPAPAVTAEKKPTTAAEAAQKDGKSEPVIREHVAAPGSTASVAATKSGAASDDAPAKAEPRSAKVEAKDDKAEPKAPKAEQKDADKDEPNPLVAQLAALGVDEDDEEIQEKVAKHLAQGGELPEPDGDEPINRGLLLKFLSSVRN